VPPIPPDRQSPYGGEAPTASAPEPIELWERATVLKFFGGDKPLHVSTLYRGVGTGRYPPPVNVSANVVRWVGHECRAARQRMLAARAEPKPPPRRGRPRRLSVGADLTAASQQTTKPATTLAGRSNRLR
jgi:hypothetical protein